MENNIAKWERGIRIFLGLGLLSLLIIGPQSIWGLIGIIPLSTGLLGFCPLYLLRKKSTS